jgi:hypothetical protein
MRPGTDKANQPNAVYRKFQHQICFFYWLLLGQSGFTSQYFRLEKSAQSVVATDEAKNVGEALTGVG